MKAEKFGEACEMFRLLIDLCDQKKIYPTNDGKPLLPFLWKRAKELTER